MTDDEDELQEIVRCEEALALATEELLLSVRAARAAGVTWTDIGELMGVTRQAAQQRWSRLRRQLIDSPAGQQLQTERLF